MPKRPRQHQLEDQSRLAFRAKLPPHWVFRDSVPDYGIDGSVEIFDEHDLSTGRLFLVQLKATDEPDLIRAFAVSLRLDTCKYYDSLDLSVLIVRFHAPTGRLYVRWFHTFDPYYGRRARKSVTFYLSPDDGWSDKTATKLISDLDTIRIIRSPQIPLPVIFKLVLTESKIHGVPAPQVASAIRKAADRLPSVIAVNETPSTDPLGSIVVGNDKVAIDLAGAHGFTLHTSKGYPTELVLSKFPYDVLVGAALALDRRGHSGIAARLMAEYATDSSLIKKPEIAIRTARCMARAHRVTEALQLSESFLEMHEAQFSALVLTVPAYLQDPLSRSEQEYFQEFLRRRIERAEQAGDQQRAATAHYNLGNHLRASRQSRLALRHYREASEYDPAYLKRKYFWRELAGILFIKGRYRLAAQFYERAIILGEERGCRALYADALMFSGRYRKSQEEFEAYLGSVTDADAEWQLKAWILPHIRRVSGFDEQKRQMAAATKLACPDIQLPPEQQRQQLAEAIRYDGLCSLTWFNLGALQSKLGRKEEAFVSFLAAGLTQSGDVEAWCNAMVLASSSEEHRSLTPYIAETAYWVNGEHFLEQVVKWAQMQDARFPVTEFVNSVNEFLTRVPKKMGPVELRLLKEGSEYDVITLGPHDTDEQKGG